jgi:hypothetical protein
MTGDRDDGRGDLPHQELAAAERDLAEVKDLLQGVARREADSGELTQKLQEYLQEHGPALKAAASAVGEETRRQTLQELYKWRAQLDAQLEARRRAT